MEEEDAGILGEIEQSLASVIADVEQLWNSVCCCPENMIGNNAI
jgi:hypothetical protein